MEFDFVRDITSQAIKVTIMIASPMLLGALVIGIFVSLFQAVTQINEQTLSFIPKIMVIVGMLVIFAPWIADVLSTFTRDLIINIPRYVLNR